MILLVRVMAALLAALPLAAQYLPNSCANPYWADTLRCKAFPAQPPQPNAASVPTVIHPFTRVFLVADPNIRCLDGTRPVIYVDKAVGGDTNDWMFTMTGGESIHPVDTDADGIPDDAQEIVDTYAIATERDEMGSANKPVMKTLDGIHNPDPVLNPEFSNWNRIRVDKCAYDRYMGRTSWETPGGFFTANAPGGGAAASFNLYSQGYLMIREAIELLGPGLTYTTWEVDAVTGQIVAVQETLPPLEDAERVMFVAHSNGAHGLYHNIDNLAAELAALPGFAGDVRALMDAHFMPAMESEVAFDANALGFFDLYDQITTGSSTTVVQTFSYDGATHYPASQRNEQYQTIGAQLDASCLAAHAAASEEWRCIDRFHVLFNHIATPFFIRQDFHDQNESHLENGNAHTPTWANTGTYPHCPTSTCLPRMLPSEYGARLREQFAAMVELAHTDSELATNADTTLVGGFPTFFFWLPDCGMHEGVNQDWSFFDTGIDYLGTTTWMSEFVEDFWLAGRADPPQWFVHGWTDPMGNAMSKNCP